MLRQRFILLGKCLLVFFLLLVTGLLFERFRGQFALSRARQLLTSRGEKLTGKDFELTIPDADNGAQAFTEAVQLIQKGDDATLWAVGKMKMMDSGRALVGWKEEQWVLDKTVVRWEQVEHDIQTNAVVLGRIQKVLESPRIHHKLDYFKGMNLYLPHLVNTKSLSSRFGPASQLAIRQGKGREAREHLVAQALLTRVMEDDRLIISELVRIAIARIARASVWEALQSAVLTSEDLLLVQRAWAGLSFIENMGRSLEGERVFGDVSFELMRGSSERTLAALSGMETVRNFFPGSETAPSDWKTTLKLFPYGAELADFIERHLYVRVWRFAWSHQVQARSMMEMHRLTEIARMAAKTKSYASVKEQIEKLETETKRTGLYDRLRFPFDNPILNVSSSVRKAMEAETERSLILCALALKRYALQHGRHPESLESLVPEYLSAVPVDFMDGKPMRYRLQADGTFLLYSVGADGVDQGGDPSVASEEDRGESTWGRKDVVWPQPAQPDEVKAWREKSGLR